MKIGAIILAGGEGRRFGGDKTWAEFQGQSFLKRSVLNLEYLGSEVIVATAKGRQLPSVASNLNVKVVEDYIPGKGPLMGIYVGLSASSYQYNLVTACDMPYVNRWLIGYMTELAPYYDIVIPRSPQALQPLQAIYSRECLPEIGDLLARGKLKIEELLKRVKVRFIAPAEIEHYDPTYLSFANINTPADLLKAEGMLARL
jgi:molybdenum cofactor guanylyltransferase